MAAVSSEAAWFKYPTFPPSRLVGAGSNNSSEWSLEELDLSEMGRRGARENYLRVEKDHKMSIFKKNTTNNYHNQQLFEKCLIY